MKVTENLDPHAAFIEAATVSHENGHRSGTLDQAQVLLAAHPEIAGSSIYAASVLGDDLSVRGFLQKDPKSAIVKGGPHGWDALICLCFLRYLRLDSSRSAGFVGAASALLATGANPNAGFYENNHQSTAGFESVLYGAAGVAHHEELTRLLLEHGADPNDEEVSYHAPESYDNGVLKALVLTGRLTEDSLATMLLRKHDWHDYQGVKWLLENGANPNRPTRWGRTPLQQAVSRDNAIEIFEVSLDHGGNPAITTHLPSAAAIAARRGRGDLLRLFDQRGFVADLLGVEALLAACARNDTERSRSITAREPGLIGEIIAGTGKFLAEFAGVGNTAGVHQLLNLGVDVAARFAEGDGYWDVAKNSTALHVAAWRARHDTVKLLIEKGAPIDALDGKGRTPLALAVRACVDSYWTDRRSPESVKALLTAGASAAGIPFPSGYAEVDALLRR